jgi:hypothetical protein
VLWYLNENCSSSPPHQKRGREKSVIDNCLVETLCYKCSICHSCQCSVCKSAAFNSFVRSMTAVKLGIVSAKHFSLCLCFAPPPPISPRSSQLCSARNTMGGTLLSYVPIRTEFNVLLSLAKFSFCGIIIITAGAKACLCVKFMPVAACMKTIHNC